MANSFIWKMAWRDSRSSRRRLLLFSISITLGIAALVSIGSFRHSLGRAIDAQAREVRFSTMATFPKSNGTRLASVRAIGGDFPFYGPMETVPAAAGREF